MEALAELSQQVPELIKPPKKYLTRFERILKNE
jgi:hypothetical protein